MAEPGDGSILYLSAADVLAYAISPAEMNAAVEAALKAAAMGEAHTRAAMSTPAGDRESFRAKGGVLRSAGYGAVKWYGYFPRNPAAGLPEYRPLLMLNETQHGFPVAIMNGEWITAVRTAAISAVGAKFLADPDSTRIGFVGCGVQARANLDALLPLFPIQSALCYGRRVETAEAFAAFCRGHGVAATVTTDPHRAVAEADIVVTTVPRLSAQTQFLDAGWVAPGGFVAMVDAGVSWAPDSLSAFSSRFSDEMQQATHRAEQGDVVDGYAAALTDVVGGAHPGRRAADERIALLFTGTGLADVAAAVLIYERARALGLGQTLPV